MKNIVHRVMILAILAGPAPVALAQQTGSGYHIVDSLKLGGEGGWDYLTVDASTRRMFLSRGTRVQVVDLAKNTLLGEIPNTPGVHGIAIVPAKGLGYTSNGRDSSVTAFDLKTLEPRATIKIGGRNPDAIIYDPASGRVFTFNGGSSSTTAIDPGTNTVVGTLPLGGRPEFAVSDGHGRIYVNLEDRSEVACVDAKALKLLHSWSIAPGEEPSGLAIDREHGLLFSGCRNKMMVISNAVMGKVVTTVPIGSGVDATRYDAKDRLAFSSNGDGTITVVKEESPEKFSVVDNAVTRRGARTMEFDESNGRIYTVTAKFGPPPAATPERPHPRPAIEPGSVTLYILGR